MAVTSPWQRAIAALALRGLVQAAPYLAHLAERSAGAGPVGVDSPAAAPGRRYLESESIRLREIRVDPLGGQLLVREMTAERRFHEPEAPAGRRAYARLPAGALVATLVLAAPLVLQGIRLLSRQNARPRQLVGPESASGPRLISPRD